MNFRFDIIYEYRWMFFYGALTTLGLTVVATAGGSVFGLLLALARMIYLEKAGAPMRALAWVLRKFSLLYVTLFRGTPLFVQIVIWAYVWFPFFVHPTDGLLMNGNEAKVFRNSYGALVAGSLALIANSGAYICEIFRAGIQSIDRGQMEAARSLGLSYSQAMRYVILPQALRRMLPPLASEFVTLLKDSSLLSVIAVAELTYVQKTISGRYYIYEEPLYTIALIYLLMTTFLGWVFLRLESRYNPQHR
nr:amino acid ABC transporter permease [uncultured Neisseria sp.]